MLAVYGGRTAIVDRLLACENIDINAQDKNGMTALMLAIQSKPGPERIIDRLLACENIDINAQDKYGITALMSAVRDKNTAIIDRLLKCKKIDINAQDKYGITALMLAIQSKPGPERTKIIDRLLACENIDINAKNKNGMTALMLAVEHNVEHENVSIVGSFSSRSRLDIKNSEHIQALQDAFFGSRNFKAMLPILAQLNSGFSKQEYEKDNTEHITLSYTLQDKTYKFSFIKDELINSIRELLLSSSSLQDRAKFAIYEACGMSKSNLNKLDSLLPNKFIAYLKSGRKYSENK